MSVREFHRRAMHLYDQARYARAMEELPEADVLQLVQHALQEELRAVELVAPMLDAEPTRGIIIRSAASMALECNEVRKAEQLASLGLAGNPTDDVADDFREIVERANFLRHLKLDGVELEPAQIQMSLSGPAVAPGLVDSRLFLRRFQSTKTLVERTFERKKGLPYRQGGSTSSESRIFLGIPRAASYAVTIQIGHVGDQLDLDGMEEFLHRQEAEVADEIVDCFELFENRDLPGLAQRIPEEAYFNNFVSMARSIAPDGEQIKTVGFTVFRQGRERSVQLVRPGGWADAEPQDLLAAQIGQEAPPPSEVVVGRLLMADARHKQERLDVVSIVLQDGASRDFLYEKGLDDVVAAHWGTLVRIEARKDPRRRRQLVAHSITPVEE